MKRRDVVLGAAGGAVRLAGCSALPSDSDVDLAIFNHTDIAYNALFEFYDEESNGRSEARVYETGSSGYKSKQVAKQCVRMSSLLDGISSVTGFIGTTPG